MRCDTTPGTRASKNQKTLVLFWLTCKSSNSFNKDNLGNSTFEQSLKRQIEET